VTVLTYSVLFSLLAQTGISQSTCPHDVSTNGTRIVVRGELLGDHDLILAVPGCDRLVVNFAYQPDFRNSHLNKMRWDESLLLFRDFLHAEQPERPGVFCVRCPKYRVTAILEGRLDISASAA
jgi:hypothetical protein